jgi:hypothetical protein
MIGPGSNRPWSVKASGGEPYFRTRVREGLPCRGRARSVSAHFSGGESRVPRARSPGRDNDWVSAQFGPDGSQVYGVYPGGTAFVWDVDPARWADHACEVAGRQLTEDEWQRFLPDRPYEPACSGG